MGWFRAAVEARDRRPESLPWVAALEPQSAVLRTTAALVGVIAGFGLAVTALKDPPQYGFLVGAVIGIVAAVAALGASTRGHDRRAGTGLAIATWIAIAIANLDEPGASGFVVAALVCGLLLGPRAAVLSAVAGSAVLALFGVAGRDISEYGHYVVMLLGGASLVALVSYRVEQAIDRERGIARRYRQIVQDQPLGVFVTDRDLKILLANPVFAEMVGFDSPDPLIGRSLREGRGLEVPEILALAEGMLRGEEGVAEGSFRSIGGKWVELRIHVAPIRDESGAVIGGQAVCEDISARLETERALNESQARFNAIIDGDIDLVTELRSDGSQAYVSPNAARLFGIDWDRAGSGDHLHPDDLEALTEVIARVRNSRRPERFEYRIREQSGDWRWLESSIAPFAAHDEVRTIVVTRDVTQRRQLEEDLRQAQKMEAVGNLAAGVAHDFNNLLTAIGGNAELLIGSEALTEADRESAGEILAAAGRATALTRQLLTFSRKQPIDSRSVPLDATIAELEVMLRRLLGAHIELRFALGAGEACIQCDPIHLEQLVVNLALNARDAMPEGGRLRIETEAYPDAAAGAFGFARLIVSDTGVGMSAETRARIFEPFFTTKSVGEGTGLGLSTAYVIVEQVGGEIGVESEPSRGSRFTVKLPCSEPEFPVASDSTLPERCSGAGPATILLAEDEEAVRAVARAALESAGHQVIEAADGEEALAIAREHGGIDAVVTDVVMPRRGGLSVAEELSITHPGLPVLLISGYQPDPEATLAKPLLGKPFTRAQLTRSVSDMLVKRSGSAA